MIYTNCILTEEKFVFLTQDKHQGTLVSDPVKHYFDGKFPVNL